MDEDIRIEIQKILYGIEQFENGNDEYLEYILAVIDALRKYKYTALKSYIRAELLFAFSKFTTFVACNELTTTYRYKEIIDKIDEDLEFYLYSSKELQKYVKECKKTLNYPNLDAAYMLSIKLSTILNVYTEYLSEIRSMEKAYQNNYTYYGNMRLDGENEKVKEDVSILVKALEPGIKNV